MKSAEASDVSTPEAPRVALVSMPFVSAERPSIQLGLLQALARREGASVQTFSFNLDFARLVGKSAFESLCRYRGRQLGEWLFSLEAFHDRAPDPEHTLLDAFGEEIDGLLGSMIPSQDRGWLLRLRTVLVPAFLTALEEAVPWGSYVMIGFTSTFQQTVPSLALASRLKRRWPHLRVVFGGANFDGDMGMALLEANQFIDCAVLGEGDEAFPALIRALSGDDPRPTLPNVAWRTEAGIVRGPTALPFADLDSLPIPTYDDYYDRAVATGVHDAVSLTRMDVPFEAARGCWWGAKHHCVFCGLNAGGMAFRSKSPQRVLAELETLSRRHRTFRFEAVDNIMDRAYIERVFGPAATAGYGWDFFFEVKSNLSRDDLRKLAAGGVRRIQPGIESLDTGVLKQMRKGVTAIQNVNLLRWCAYYDIRVSWNLLWGFPGERPETYASQAALMKLLVHLQPPDGGGRIWMERYSPLFAEHQAFPTETLEPEESYRYVYPTHFDLDAIAYFFRYRFEDRLADQVYDNVSEVMLHWRELAMATKPPQLTFYHAPGFLRIDDGRVPDDSGRHEIEGMLADLYPAISDQPLSARTVARSLDLVEAEVTEALDGYVDRGLAMRDGSQYLALALPAVRGR